MPRFPANCSNPSNPSTNLKSMKKCTHPSCSQINPQPFDSFTKNRSRKDGMHYWCKTCVRANDKKRDAIRKSRRKPYLVHRKNHCEECPFVAKHPCQLDVDHIDGNHNNNDVSNLRTLCANCHRLKTQLNKDFLRRSKAA